MGKSMSSTSLEARLLNYKVGMQHKFFIIPTNGFRTNLEAFEIWVGTFST